MWAWREIRRRGKAGSLAGRRGADVWKTDLEEEKKTYDIILSHWPNYSPSSLGVRRVWRRKEWLMASRRRGVKARQTTLGVKKLIISGECGNIQAETSSG